jgi:hypothetical protein
LAETKYPRIARHNEVVMDEMKLAVASWNRFIPRNLYIKPELVGATHSFSLEGFNISIKLPGAQHIHTEPSRGDLFCEGDLLALNSWKEEKGVNVPLEFEVLGVDIEVLISEEIYLSEEVLNRNPCAFDIISDSQQAQLNQLAKRHETVAEKAFDLWVRTLRWKCNNYSIGRPEISGCESGWSTYIIAKPLNKRIWSTASVIHVNIRKPVTSETWSKVEYALKDQCAPPVYIDLMMDASEHLQLDDFQRTTVDLAIACETYLRMLVSKNLPVNLPSSLSSYIDDANIRQVLDKFVIDILGESELKILKKIRKKLHRLFDTRNKIVHKGESNGLTKELCIEFLETTRNLFVITDDVLPENTASSDDFVF